MNLTTAAVPKGVGLPPASPSDSETQPGVCAFNSSRNSCFINFREKIIKGIGNKVIQI